MKKYSLDHFLNEERRKQNIREQLQIIAGSSRRLKARQKERSPEELRLLIKAMMQDIKRWEEEGKIEKNGRKWKLNT